MPIREIGLPQHKNLYGDSDWGSETQYADYAGIAARQKPFSILEMGVYCGYSACAMLWGYPHAKVYVGIDSEIEMPRSMEIAASNLDHFNFLGKSHLLKMDLLACDDDFIEDNHDLVHIDAIHTITGTFHTLKLGWSKLMEDGILVLDDVKTEPVNIGLQKFLWWLGERDESVRVQLYNNYTGWCILKKGWQ